MYPSVAPRAACNKTVIVRISTVSVIVNVYSVAALTLLLRVDSQLDPGELYSTHIVT